jgi:alginate O-acetyltransferase complex protein AlgI
MRFNSLAFGLFFPPRVRLYWLIPRARLRAYHACLLLVSSIFYGGWDWHFLSLLDASALVAFWGGLGWQRRAPPAWRRALLAGSLLGNVGMLGFFQSAHFFVDSFGQRLHGFGIAGPPSILNSIFPVAIRFSTFQTLNSGVDRYRRHMQATMIFGMEPIGILSSGDSCTGCIRCHLSSRSPIDAISIRWQQGGSCPPSGKVCR